VLASEGFKGGGFLDDDSPEYGIDAGLLAVIIEGGVVESVDCLETMAQYTHYALLALPSHFRRSTTSSRVDVAQLITIISPYVLILDYIGMDSSVRLIQYV
jgi:hypothetical protein